MQKTIDEILSREIRALTAFLHDLPDNLRQDFYISGAPVGVFFGPDIETRFLKNGENMMDSPGKGRSILSLAKNAFTDAPFLAQEDAIMLDNRMLEIKLAPDDPLKICDHYNDMAHRLAAVSESIHAKAHIGQGHWHVSLMQNGANLFQTSLTMRYRAAAGIVFSQKTFPAFFVKPHIAEEDFNIYVGPYNFMFQKKLETASVRLHERYSTLEPRLAKHAPYQPAYLTLAAIRYGLENGSCAPNFDEPYQFIKGKFEYLNMLETTRRNIDECPLIPRDIAVALFERSLADYRAYLQAPRISLSRYTSEQEDCISNRLDALSRSVSPQAMPMPQAA